jgi:hypothetical protein
MKGILLFSDYSGKPAFEERIRSELSNEEYPSLIYLIKNKLLDPDKYTVLDVECNRVRVEMEDGSIIVPARWDEDCGMKKSVYINNLVFIASEYFVPGPSVISGKPG